MVVGNSDRRSAIGKIAFSGREHVVAIMPDGQDGKGLMASTLRYKNELRDKADYFRDIKKTEVDVESLELAEALIAKRQSFKNRFVFIALTMPVYNLVD